MDADIERGLLAIKLFKVATTTNPEQLLADVGDAEHMEFRKAWRFAKQMLSVDEIASFREMLKHYADD